MMCLSLPVQQFVSLISAKEFMLWRSVSVCLPVRRITPNFEDEFLLNLDKKWLH